MEQNTEIAIPKAVTAKTGVYNAQVAFPKAEMDQNTEIAIPKA